MSFGSDVFIFVSNTLSIADRFRIVRVKKFTENTENYPTLLKNERENPFFKKKKDETKYLRVYYETCFMNWNRISINVFQQQSFKSVKMIRNDYIDSIASSTARMVLHCVVSDTFPDRMYLCHL